MLFLNVFPGMLEILKAFLKTTSGTVINILLGSLSVKILASILGTEGFGFFSFLRQIQSTALIAATGGQAALVQGGSSQQGLEQKRYLQAVFLLTLMSACTIAIGIFLLAPLIATYIIGRSDRAVVWMVRLLAISVCLSVFSAYANGVLNIYRALGQMAASQILGALASALIAYPVAQIAKQGYVAVLSVIFIVMQATTLVFSIGCLWKAGHLNKILYNLRDGYEKTSIRRFLKFSGVTALTALISNLILLAIRVLLARKQGLASVGIFEAAWTLSMTYVSLVTSAFGAYYLPTLSSLQQQNDRAVLVEKMFRFATLTATLLVVLVIVTKQFALQFLFSTEFTPALLILRWMLIGDYFKITSWAFAYPMLAFADMRMLFWTEIFWNGSMLLASIYSLVFARSMEGLGISFFLLYVIYLIFTLWYIRAKHSFTFRQPLIINWAVGLFLVCVASWQNWASEPMFSWITIVFWATVLTIYFVFALGADERLQIETFLRLKGRS